MNSISEYSYLGDLKDPKKLSTEFDIDEIPVKHLLDNLTMMIKIRIIEERIAKGIRENQVKTPCHLSIGQEAIPTAISNHLTSCDKVFGGHRSHAHFLSMGGQYGSLIREILGKKTGASCGRGGSMHLVDLDNGFYGSVPIVGATIPVAVGAALSIKLSKKSSIAVSYFGDGACEEGVLHESLNLASLHNLPILFVCENNLFSSHLDIELRQPSDSVARFAKAHCISSSVVDGNNIPSLYKTTKKMINDLRDGKGPMFLEAITYRWLGHVGASRDIDVGVRRSLSEIEQWQALDPILRLKVCLIEKNLLSESDFKEIYLNIYNEIEEEYSLALNDELPDSMELLHNVY